jgi:cell division protein FtsI/penicillin-binding protein 2
MRVTGNPDRRIRWILLSFSIFFCAILVRAVFLQAVNADELSALADEQHVQQIELPAQRGTIYDRFGNELAVGQETRTIYATPYLIDDPLDVARRLAPILGMDENDLLATLSDQDAGFAYVARKVDPEVADAVEAEGIAGLGVMTEEKRVYPQGSLAAQVLGFAGTDNRGLAGMELQMDETLAGTGGRERVITDAGGNHIEMLSLDEGERGSDIWLTIDQSLQFEAEKVLSETVEKWHAKGAEAIIMNPDTGEIYAMANVPTADANDFARLPDEARRNRAVTDTYEPGSVFKAFTATAGLEDGAVAPGQKLHLPVTLELGGHTIQDAYSRGPVDWDLETILENSSNIGAVTVGMREGAERLDGWIRKLGFGSPTGIDFPGEAEGILLPVDQWSGSTIGNVPIGQGVSVTAIQMATAYCVIANGGTAVTPHLVYRVGDEPVLPEAGERLISERTTMLLRQYLTTVVEGAGAPLARVEGYQVAGKTGTAQKPLPDGSGYSNENYIGSFIGFAPASDPKVVILVMVDEPHPFGGGSTVAAPAFQKIAQFTLQKMSIAP